MRHRNFLATPHGRCSHSPVHSEHPLAADVNWVPGDTYDVVDNASYATVGSGGAVDIFNGPAWAAPANVGVDGFGYFSG